MKKLILLVDDTPENIQVAHSILRDSYKTRVATSGLKALEQAKLSPAPDLILLDVVMPGMDGYAVCSELKADPETRDIPVIFLTARTEWADETKGFDVGAVDYIHKPFSPPVVLSRVQTHLNLRETREQLVREKRLVDTLLDNMLPAAAVLELKQTGKVIPRRYEDVSVLFVDLVGFTSYCDQHAPEDVVSKLGDIFILFEECARRHGMEKIKTIGDAFMATGGLLEPLSQPLVAAVNCGLEIAELISKDGIGWRVRAGANIGPVMAGIVGEERYQFDIWGDTVNVAARLASVASPQSVAVTGEKAIELAGMDMAPRGDVELKGKGRVTVQEVRLKEPIHAGL